MRIIGILLAVLLTCSLGCQKLERQRPGRLGDTIIYYGGDTLQASVDGSRATAEAMRASSVEKTLAAADITVSDVATFLYSRGWTIIPSATPAPHWRASAGASYHVVQLQFAIGDTIAKHYLPQTAGPYCVRVKGVSAGGVSGPWSLVGWSDGGDGSNSLPGVRP